LARRPGVKVIDVSGDYHSIGQKLGRSCRTIAHQMVSDAKPRLRVRGIEWGKNVKNCLRFVPYAEDYSPRYVDLVRGYAEGSGLELAEVLALLYEGETFGCTDCMVNSDVTSDGAVLSAHTEDWWTTFRSQIVLVRMKPRTGPAFISTTYGGLDFIGGVNSAGLSVTVNSLTQNDMRVGIPREMFSFEALSSRTIGDAINSCTPADRASGSNLNLCHKSGEMCCVELSATDHAILSSSGGCLVHTNHYLHPKMERYEAIFDEKVEPNRGYSTGSVIRYNRAWRLLSDSFGEIDLDTLWAIQKDHVNRPHSICCHEEKTAPTAIQWKTIFSVVYNPGKGSLWLGMGNPCETEHREYRIE